MADPAQVPVVIGVGDIRSGRSGAPADPREPLDLIAEAVDAALADTGVGGVSARIDSISAVKTASWAYDELPALLGERLGAAQPRTFTSPIGGHWPAALLDRIGHEIAEGTSTVSLLVGGEAQASVTALMKSGTDPGSQGWLAAPGGPPSFDPDELGSTAMQRAGMIVPTRVYPLFENRLAYELGQSPHESLERSARMYSEFSEVAAQHPVAWSPVARTTEDIATVGPKNRLVCEPYPLALNAMPFVDQAAAVIVCSLSAARELGVDENKIIYLWGGAGATDTPDVLGRAEFGRSPAMASAVARTLAQADVQGTDLDIIDAYSCFPVVPKLLLRELGLPDDTVPSVLGGHSFFGGPLNSYTLHAIAQTTRLLRERTAGDLALVHGNGGYLTYQHTVLLSSRPHGDGYVGNPDAEILDLPAPPLVNDYEGEAEVVTATVEYGRDGLPAMGLLIATIADGRRIAGYTDAEGAAALARLTDPNSRSVVGAAVRIADRGGLLTVSLQEEATA
ncbi:MAG: acetyl-CoA acetyltransferase [Rhodococcus sp. (in: high G+C Gram-positive bacteria)]|uniref:acetyl-CoA acetyltransferase n=1 Tax=Rhodococcus sp. TaxID=1831 RepID=UPI003BB17C60